MAFITLRQANVVNSPNATIKGSPLTNAEVDNNFANLNLTITGVANALANLSSDSISNGTSNVSISTANGPIVISANLIPNVGNVINLGSNTNRFKDLFLSGNTINLGGDTISSVGGFIRINNANVFTTTGNIASDNIDAASITTGTLPVDRGGTGGTTSTGSGAVVLATSPSLVTPTLGIPQSGTLTNCSFPTLNQNTTGSAATLTTPRNIGGVSFNGSTDINLPGVNTTGNQNTTGSAATLTTARTINGISFNGSTNITVPGDIPSGTVMLFGQTAAPTGFTKLTDQDNAALRVVSGTASTGGSVNFSTAFASQTPTGSVSVSGSTGAITLSTPQIPSHTHGVGFFVVNQYGPYGGVTRGTSGIGSLGQEITTGATGGGGSHNHPLSISSATFAGSAINLAVKFVDIIRATKN